MCADAKDFEIASKSNINKKKELQDLMPQKITILYLEAAQSGLAQPK